MTATEVVENQTKAVDEMKVEVDETPDERKAEAFECLMDGKRNLLCKDIPAAVCSLAEACEVLSAECGEKAPECGEAYYYYGKALLEMARLENLVLGNALSGVPDGEDVDASPQVENPETITDEERADIEGKVDEALEDNFGSCEKAEAPLLAMDSEAADTSEDVPTTTECEGEESHEDEGAESEQECQHPDDAQSAADHEAKAGEEPSNLQLAWEVLEVSKLICKEQLEAGSKDKVAKDAIAAMEKRFCDTHHLLSEVSVESGNYGQAVEDLKVCLDRQKVALPKDCRDIAVTYYQLGVAQGFDKKYDEAIASLEAAVTVLDSTLASLKGKPGKMAKMEITEIEALLPDIKAKIADVAEMKAGKVEDVSQEGGNCPVKGKLAAAIPTKRKSDEGLSEEAKKARA